MHSDLQHRAQYFNMDVPGHHLCFLCGQDSARVTYLLLSLDKDFLAILDKEETLLLYLSLNQPKLLETNSNKEGVCRLNHKANHVMLNTKIKRWQKHPWPTQQHIPPRSLEQGLESWAKPWSSGNTSGRIVLPRRSNGKSHRGINILMLWGAIVDRGYRFPTWLTYGEATEQGGQVRKGETGSEVVYAGSITRIFAWN